MVDDEFGRPGHEGDGGGSDETVGAGVVGEEEAVVRGEGVVVGEAGGVSMGIWFGGEGWYESICLMSSRKEFGLVDSAISYFISCERRRREIGKKI